ncbi:MAG TPA: hypothetical protein VFH34_14915 [Anaerolineales bacterium]|nr:hypothetical protein [Anaerolineales bacterium]
MKDILEKIMSDARYLKNIEYGEPRSGHPEGKIKFHIQELEENLEKFVSRGISDEQYWKLKFLIHVHDTFKADATPDVPILNPNSHASLAKTFAAEFVNDEDLLNMLQFHDLNYALWQQSHRTGSYDVRRLENLLETIQDWDLFLMFLILDGSTKGKERSKLVWFMKEAAKYKESKVDESWVL